MFLYKNDGFQPVFGDFSLFFAVFQKKMLTCQHLRTNTNRKRDNFSATNRFVISFCLYKSLALHVLRLTDNAMLPLSGFLKFSAKRR